MAHEARFVALSTRFSFCQRLNGRALVFSRNSGNVKGEDATHFPPVFLAIRSMSAIGIICHWSLAPPAATHFPSSIIIAVTVLPHRRQFRRGSLMRNTCSE